MGKGRSRLDLIGQGFGLLRVTAFAGMRDGRSTWVCECACGGESIVVGSLLRNGHTASCGCAARHSASARCRDRNTSHGMRYVPEYKIWGGMIRRCHAPTDPGFKNYGARGIAVCDRWRGSFESFFADMGSRPSPQHSLDRWPDQSGDYEPGNVRWATDVEQANNRKSNHLVTYRGEVMTLREAIRAAGEVADRGTVHFRLERLDWPVERAVETPSPTWLGDEPPS